ncbi:MAG: hypothetical protein N2508_13445 [Anaerolineae bacterium]|nr:hypothetical protein [Anaerolineae bacterium]
MAWQMYTVKYELRSPLHIGYHKVGNVQRTRYYIPARNLWAAITEALTRRGFNTGGVPEGDYAEVGDWVKDHCAFSYWFIEEDGTTLSPRYGGELKYGRYTVAKFERLYLRSHVTTALDAATTSAEEGSLHEVEVIAPYTQDGKRTIIGGLVFLDGVAKPVLGDEEKWRDWLGDLQIGGERRYGFGRLCCLKFQNNDAAPEEYSLEHERPLVRVRGSEPLLAHTPANDLRGRGEIEPLLGRQTDTKRSDAFGCRLTKATVCWIPGTLMENTEWFEIGREGMWRKKNLR